MLVTLVRGIALNGPRIENSFYQACCSSGWICSPSGNTFHSKRWSGHNKWSNIRHIKGAKDAERGAMIGRMIGLVNVAIREGNGKVDPNVNTKLAKVLERCKSLGVPKDTITRALERAKNVTFKPEYLHIVGPAGSMFIVEYMSSGGRGPEKSRILGPLRKLAGFTLRDEKALSGSFEKKGVVTILKKPEHPDHFGEEELQSQPPPPNELDLEGAENIAIEVGAEEVEESVGQDGRPTIEFYCHEYDISRISKALEELRYNVISSEIAFMPIVRISPDEDGMDKINMFYEKIDMIDDVTNVYDNIHYTSIG